MVVCAQVCARMEGAGGDDPHGVIWWANDQAKKVSD